MKSFLQILGFLLFVLGFVSIVLSMVGLKFSFLAWIDYLGRTPAFLVKIAMTFGGVILMYLLRIDPKEYD